MFLSAGCCHTFVSQRKQLREYYCNAEGSKFLSIFNNENTLTKFHYLIIPWTSIIANFEHNLNSLLFLNTKLLFLRRWFLNYLVQSDYSHITIQFLSVVWRISWQLWKILEFMVIVLASYDVIIIYFGDFSWFWASTGGLQGPSYNLSICYIMSISLLNNIISLEASNG